MAYNVKTKCAFRSDWVQQISDTCKETEMFFA